MKVKYLLTISILLSGLYSFAHADEVKVSTNEIIERLKCDSITEVKTKERLYDLLDQISLELSKYQSNDRHSLSRSLNSCTPNKNSKALMIAFEGTGAFEPKVATTQAIAIKCLASKVHPSLINSIYNITKEVVAKNESKEDLLWSGLNTGVQLELFKHESFKDVDWYSFPSEESEALADIKLLKNYNLEQLIEDVQNSVNGNPKGISNATICLINYFHKAKQLNITPKIILTSHSSGARSLVKFSQKMKQLNFKVELAFTIDPVIEAHETLKEVLPQKLGEPARWAQYKLDRLLGKNPNYPYSRVWSRSYPTKLYKSSNVLKLINFYQQSDNLGLKIGGDALKFGIYGSPIHGADSNELIKGLSDSGHGEVTYHKEVLRSFRNNLKLSLDN
ncbi:hypothetical protein [Halobacteriovorax sp. HLS]|uniref:hypothetical protein n=1 Tax=Halobacteriovorax sp. HLS TaxID=2234000 RepID=UPI000FDA3B83|nr:hypothetical protein [Halobacteriovorax sp. HLS]